MKEKLISLLIVSAFVGFLVSSLRAAQVTNVSAAASSFVLDIVRPIYAVNGAGLVGEAHTNEAANFMWESLNGDIDGAWFLIDLKMNFLMDATNTLKVWNWNWPGELDRGIKAATFSYSADSLTFIELTNVTSNATNAPNTFDIANGLNTYSNYTTISFSTNVTARYIKITVNGGAGVGNYGDGSFCGLSEVQAFGTFVSDPTNFLGAQITVSNATASSTYSATYTVTNLINGSGLTGLAHNTTIENMWFTADGATNVNNAYVDFDMNVSTNLGAVRIWNGNLSIDNRAIRTVDILVSDDPTFTSGVITNYNNIELLMPPQINGYDNPQIIDMKRVSGRYVRISNMGNSNPNWASAPQNVCLSEVQFFEAIPIPAGTVFTIY